MGDILAECLAAPAEYFLPVRILRILRDRARFPGLRITLEPSPASDAPDSGRRVFASTPDAPDDSTQSSCRLGSHYRLDVLGVSGEDRTLSLLGASLASRLASSRPSCLSRELPPERSPADLARTLSARFADSQTAYATLCVLDPRPFLHAAAEAFPEINPECLEEDLARCLSAYFEASGGLFLCDTGALIALCCGSRPVDTELLQSQAAKYIRRFLSAAVDSPIRIQRSRTFEVLRPEDMESFLAECFEEPGS